MDYRAAMQISAVGMNLEKARLEVAAMNLANMHVSQAPGTAPFSPMRVIAKANAASFQNLIDASRGSDLAPLQVALVPTQTPDRLEHDPGHPHADAKGYVRYPGINHAHEMLTAMSAMRAYEANVAAANMAKTMATRALEIGGQS
jgi:flagellar basal-body rod protein FlgC